jgi:AcrR family transcriptional regulator
MARRAPPSTKSDLLHAAEACFAEHGLDATKVEDITARAGIAKGAFYSYFAGKEECWQQIVEAFLTRLAVAVEQPVRGVEPGLPLAQRFVAWLEHDVALLQFCWENRALLGLLMNGAGGAAYAHLLDEFAARAAKNAQARIAALVAEGLYRRDVDPALVASLLAGAYDRLVRELIKQPQRPPIEALARQTQSIFTRGLFTDVARTQIEPPVTVMAARVATRALRARGQAGGKQAIGTRRSK